MVNIPLLSMVRLTLGRSGRVVLVLVVVVQLLLMSLQVPLAL
jgi:hypothetical protein